MQTALQENPLLPFRKLQVFCFTLLFLSTSLTQSIADQPEVADRIKSRRVLIVGVDGTRPDALAKAKTPHFDQLIESGTFTDTAQILGTRYQENDTISGPGWSSILTGVWADKHGVHDNSFRGRQYELFPHFFKHLKRARPEAETISLVSWEPISEYIVDEADIDHFEPLPRGEGQTLDLQVSGDQLSIDTRDGQWHHLLGVRKEGQIRMYLDGRLVAGPVQFSGQFDLAGDFYYVGRDPRSGNTCFQGQMDDVQIWKRALTDAEISTISKTSGHLPKSAISNELLIEYTFEGKGERALTETAGHAEGPFILNAVDTALPPQFAVVRNGSVSMNSQVLDLPEKAGNRHGLRTQLNKSLRSLTQGDFTIGARFRTTDKGRNILMGNFAAGVGVLNLELHEANRVRLYLQPPNPQTPNLLKLEDDRDRAMAERAARLLQEQDPTAMFVYFHQVDATGHGIGFSPDVPQYLQAIENVDSHLGTVLDSLIKRPTYDQEDWLIIVCTDHGGIRKTHGSGQDIPEICQVFLIFNSPAIKAGRITEQAYIVDVATTALTHLIGPVDARWGLDGRNVLVEKAE